MKIRLAFVLLLLCVQSTNGQVHPKENPSKKRLDFARTYFEAGVSTFPAFSGARTSGGLPSFVNYSETVHPYLNWGGFHFWGHAEFYVSIPLGQFALDANTTPKFNLNHAVVTGVRVLPWIYEEKKISPFLGISWSAIDFEHLLDGDEKAPKFSKDFSIVPEAGILFGSQHFILRLSANYFSRNRWEYPVSRDAFETIEIPRYSVQFGLLYTFDSSKNENDENLERWNSYPIISRPGSRAQHTGNLFIGLGPSSSFSLSRSNYTEDAFPFLQDRLSSETYLDISAGYHWNKAGLFIALSFRNPLFKTLAYGAEQKIQKTSLALEANVFLTDYSGFTPYLGLNVAYDQITYKEEGPRGHKELKFSQLEPGLTLGWDILPGKTDEFLILRTNLRWYPFSSFEVDGKSFAFSQFEYNLIQAIFYPERIVRSRK